MSNKIKFMIKKELMETFRDKKTLIYIFLMPLMVPLLLFFVAFSADSQNTESNNYEKYIGIAYDLSDAEVSILNSLEINYHTGSEKEMKKMYNDQDIYCYITKNNNNYTINYEISNQEALVAAGVAEGYLNTFKTYKQDVYLTNSGINSNNVLNIITINHKNISKRDANFFTDFITSYVFLMIIMVVSSVSTYPSVDSTAGEKERGTMETLLTMPIKNSDIIVGKYLAVTFATLLTVFICYILSYISLIIINSNFNSFKDYNLIPQIPTIIISLLILICYTFMVCGICISITSRFKTFKEAQGAVTPIVLFSSFPGLILNFVSIKITNLLACVPFLNYHLIYSEILTGTYDVMHISLMFLSTFILIYLFLNINIRQFKSEKVLFS